VHLDALVLAEDQMVVEAMADFSRLPYFDGTQDVNPDVANISEEIVSTPFENQNLPLKAGIHLHWSLPDALTRARYSPDTPDKQDFPRVPNWWLVTRCNNNGVVEKEWIVESDYLYPESDEDHSAMSVTIPYRRGQSPQPFRYLGRSMELKDSSPDAKDEYYPKLTAVGYGEPTFAAFYPNCHSVFGFYDPDYSANLDERQYYVIGWYSDPAQDYLNEFIKARVDKAVNNESLIKALEDDFKWTLSPGDLKLMLSLPGTQDFPARMLCYARLVVSKKAEDEKEDGPVTIAVGNTGTEALSAYLAETLAKQSDAKIKKGATKNIIEDQLEGLQLSPRLEHRQLDVGPKFLEARHEKGFTAAPGGSLWAIQPESTTTEAADAGDADAGITLPDDMAHLLNAANDRQQEYDRAWQEIESLRKQLFSDWYKYMLCAYPPEDARDDYPNIDEVKSYVEVNVASLNNRIIEAGTLAKDDRGKFKAANDGPTLCSLAARLSEVINNLQASVDKHNEETRLQQRLKELGFDRDGKLVEKAKAAVTAFQKSRGLTPDGTIGPETRVALRQFVTGDKLTDANPSYRLKQISGPRYWQPTEPVLLIKGSIVEASERHGQDGRPSDGLMVTQWLKNADLENLRKDQDLRLRIRDKVSEIGRGPDSNFAFSQWTRQPWNPFLLEWEVEVFPLENKSNLDPVSGSYSSDFISDNYTLSENQVDLSFQPSKGSTTRAANLYSGRSILTPHAGIQLTQQIEAYLSRSSWLFQSGDIVDAAALCKELKSGTGAISTYLRSKFAKLTSDLLNAYTPPEQPTKQLVIALVNELNLRLKDSEFPGRDAAGGSSNATNELSIAELMRANRIALENAYTQSIAQTSTDTRQAYDNIRKAYDILTAQGFNCLSQSLGGFNEALLMHKQTLQLAISDPLGFDDYQTFAASVRDAVSNSIYSAPEPLNDFNPLRSGAMTILRLRLVDTFGQIKDLDVTKVITSEPMNSSVDDFHVSLAPRLVQPARINFRWLAAEGDEQEMNDHPATTPICGWMLTNNLDNSLMIYDNRGKALGALVLKDEKQSQPAWEPAPGSPEAVKEIAKIANPHLQKMVNTIQKCGVNFLKDFISAVDNALENIEPENFAQHQDIALLMGYPLALVRAALNLELQGLPAVHQGWNDLRQDMQRETRNDNGFSQVQFPIRIGEYKQFNDGVVGYWKEKGNDYEGDVFYAPQSDEEVEITDSYLKTHRTDSMTIFQSVKSEPQILSLLLDPRGLVHATSGVMPAKAIGIPPDQYAAALRSIEITFLSTPILTDVGKIHLSLPTEAGYKWSWLQQDEQGAWTEISSRGIVQRGAFDRFKSDADSIWAELIEQGWIELINKKDTTRASVTAKDKRGNQSLADSLKDKVAEIEDILDRTHIGPINPGAKFSGPQEIREGWLKLSVDDDSAT
jgi:hypothetical protein